MTTTQTMLELADECDFYAKAAGSNPKNTLLKAAKALRASSEVSEPVAWLCIWLDGGKSFTFDRPYPFAGQVIPLYASPLHGRDAQTIEACAKIANTQGFMSAQSKRSTKLASVRHRAIGGEETAWRIERAIRSLAIPTDTTK